MVVYLGRDKTIQLLEELMCELELMDPVCSSVTHMDNPPYYRISASYKIPSVNTGTQDPRPGLTWLSLGSTPPHSVWAPMTNPFFMKCTHKNCKDK